MDAIPHDVSLARGILVGAWLESVFWGLHSGFVLLCFWVFKYRRRHLRGGVLTVTLIMYVLATVHCFAELSRLINGYIDHKGDLAVLTTYNTVNDVGRMMIYVLNNSLSDAVVVWRCIVVWQRNWTACALPIVLLLAMTINGLYVTSLFATYNPNVEGLQARIITQQTAFFANSLATNSITTAFVAARIWWLAHKVSAPGLDASRYNHVVAMLIESGLLYSSLKVCELVLFVLNSNAFYIVFDSIVQIMCIAPTAIFIWVALGATEGSKYNRHPDRGGPSMNVGAVTGASFRFARPNTTMRINNTVGSGMNNSIAITAYVSPHTSETDFDIYNHKSGRRRHTMDDDDLEASPGMSRSTTMGSTFKNSLDQLDLDDDEMVSPPSTSSSVEEGVLERIDSSGSGSEPLPPPR